MKHLFLIFLAFSLLTGLAQLPTTWFGHYKGTLKVLSVNGNQTDYMMELVVQPINDSTTTWTIVYGEDSTRQERPYFLKRTGENTYIIDEDNGIVLSANKIGSKLISVFEVSGNLIHCSYTFVNGNVQFELTSSNQKFTTGNVNDTTELNKEGIPLVYGYETTAWQHAILNKIN